MSSFAYQPKSTRITARRVGPRNWCWTLSDYYLSTIQTGSGCRTQKKAFSEARKAKKKYLESLPPPKKVEKKKTNYGRSRGFSGNNKC